MKIPEFIIKMYSADSAISSKRVHGSIGYITSIVFIGIFARELIWLLLLTSIALIGLDSILDIIKTKFEINKLLNNNNNGNTQ